MFVGRQFELSQLRNLLKKQSASLAIIRGRRRIGKSRLIEEFAKKCRFIQIAGVAPTAETTAQSQREQFITQMSLQLGKETPPAPTWANAFHNLAEQVSNERVVILFDEISWMGSKDPDFLGQLKNAWDHEFSKNNQLILVLCGSVSTWITKEIINSTAFLGRHSFNLMLQELNLHEALCFMKNEHVSIHEKLKILAVTGGIPRYLELVNDKLPAETNIKNLLFVPNAPLLYEYDRIFHDIFGKRSQTYQNIVSCLINGAKTQKELSTLLNKAKNGDLSNCLKDLVESGFLHRDFTYNIRTKQQSNKSRYRLKDNFLRFYLKFVMQNLLQIESGMYEKTDLSTLPGWNSTLGLQFENLILNNIKFVIDKLNVDPTTICFFGPYFQEATNRTPGCQVDLLIQTHTNLLYVCEIKFSKNTIGTKIINEITEKMKRIPAPKGFSMIPVLIHASDISEQLEDSQFFPYMINFEELSQSN